MEAFGPQLVIGNSIFLGCDWTWPYNYLTISPGQIFTYYLHKKSTKDLYLYKYLKY